MSEDVATLASVPGPNRLSAPAGVERPPAIIESRSIDWTRLPRLRRSSASDASDGFALRGGRGGRVGHASSGGCFWTSAVLYAGQRRRPPSRLCWFPMRTARRTVQTSDAIAQNSAICAVTAAIDRSTPPDSGLKRRCRRRRLPYGLKSLFGQPIERFHHACRGYGDLGTRCSVPRYQCKVGHCRTQRSLESSACDRSAGDIVLGTGFEESSTPTRWLIDLGQRETRRRKSHRAPLFGRVLRRYRQHSRRHR